MTRPPSEWTRAKAVDKSSTSKVIHLEVAQGERVSRTAPASVDTHSRPSGAGLPTAAPGQSHQRIYTPRAGKVSKWPHGSVALLLLAPADKDRHEEGRIWDFRASYRVQLSPTSGGFA